MAAFFDDNAAGGRLDNVALRGDIVEGYVEPGMSVTVDLGNIKIGTSVVSGQPGARCVGPRSW